MATTLDFRSDTWMHAINPGSTGRAIGEGRRVWVGGEQDDDEWMVGRKTREVMIPPERCVYHWLGCETERSEGNYCAEHFKENVELERLFEETDRAQKLATRRARKAELRADPTRSTRKRAKRGSRTLSDKAMDQRNYYNRHKEEINRKKREATARKAAS